MSSHNTRPGQATAAEPLHRKLSLVGAAQEGPSQTLPLRRPPTGLATGREEGLGRGNQGHCLEGLSPRESRVQEAQPPVFAAITELLLRTFSAQNPAHNIEENGEDAAKPLHRMEQKGH